MAQSTVNLQKIKSVASELDKNHAVLINQISKLDEYVGSLTQIWTGEGASAYQNAYLQNTQNFLKLAEAINSCSQSLTVIATTYGKADMAVSDTIKAKMGGRR
jgi:WXG100 family type VII secretion target